MSSKIISIVIYIMVIKIKELATGKHAGLYVIRMRKADKDFLKLGMSINLKQRLNSYVPCSPIEGFTIEALWILKDDKLPIAKKPRYSTVYKLDS